MCGRWISGATSVATQLTIICIEGLLRVRILRDARNWVLKLTWEHCGAFKGRMAMLLSII